MSLAEAFKKAASFFKQKNETKEFEVSIHFSGYVRGVKVMKVNAKNKKEALELAKYGAGTEVSKDIIRNDTTDDDIDISDILLIQK